MAIPFPRRDNEHARQLREAIPEVAPWSLMSLVRRQTTLRSLAELGGLKYHLGDSTRTVGSACGTAFWAFAWPGGRALARYFLDYPDAVRGRNVADIGCGGGVVGIAALRVGAAEALLYDVDPVAIAASILNASANRVRVGLRHCDGIGIDQAPGTVVCAADLCYSASIVNRMMPWLRGLDRQGCLVWLADPGRAHLPSDQLDEVAKYPVAPGSCKDGDGFARVFRLRMGAS